MTYQHTRARAITGASILETKLFFPATRGLKTNDIRAVTGAAQHVLATHVHG